MKIKENAAKIINYSRKITEKKNKQQLHVPIGRTMESYYEELQMNALEPGDDFVIPILEDVNFKTNSLVKLVFTGSKGKETNIIAINAALGLRDVLGIRVPKTFGWKRTSPYFTKYDDEPKANGYIGQSFKEGISSETFLAAAQEGRAGIINIALSTSVAGEQNRHAVKNLESLVVGCMRELKKNNNIVQILYADTGIDPRKLVSVKFPTVSINNNLFKKKFKAKLEDVQSKFRNKNILKILDEEFEKLENDRKLYKKL